MRSRTACLAVVTVFLSFAYTRAEEAVYLPRGSTWKFRPGFTEASFPDTAAWRQPDFDGFDSLWQTGEAPIGYGEDDVVTDLAQATPPMRDNYTSLYLRTTFVVPRLEDVVRLSLVASFDDGFVAWINGVEVLRENVEEPFTYNAVATESRESRTYIDFDLPEPSSFLVEGTNVIAIQGFNQNVRSTDFKIDVELVDPEGPDLTPPAAASVTPAPGLTVRSLTRIEVLFTELVQGIDASDLLVNGSAANAVSGEGEGPYVFEYLQPPVGEVQVAWADSHGITDFSTRPNSFAGGSWTYNLDPSAPLPDLVITEFMASNRSGLRDEDGEFPDWVEIQNRGTEPASLAGWGITDDRGDPGKFVLPGIILGAGELLVVFASGKDRKSADGGNIHTNFKLSSSGEYCGLYSFESPREVVSEFSPRYPEQRTDISYGIADNGETGYFSPPTPGEPNGATTGFSGITAEPRFTPARGFFAEAIQVEIVSPTAGAAIYYTTDGSEPSEGNGTLYGGPIRVEGTPQKAVGTLRAVAVAAGQLPSDVVTHTYIFPQHVLAQPRNPPGWPSTWAGRAEGSDYEMDPRVVNQNPDEAYEALFSIPTLSIVMDIDDFIGPTRGIYTHANLEGLAWERPCSAELILPSGENGFQVDCGIRTQGGSSTSNYKSAKFSLRLLFKGDYGPKKLRHPLFADTHVAEFNTLVLDAHLNQTWTHPNHDQRVKAQYCRDQFMSDLQNAAGGYAPHDIFANLYVNGLFWGVYDIHERADTDFAASYFGGDESEYDMLKHQAGNPANEGNLIAWTEMFRRARVNLRENANYLALGEYLDIPNFIDYMIVNHYGGNTDWDHHNWYATRRRVDGARFRVHSWDAEHVLKSLSENRTGVNNSGQPTELFHRLRVNDEFKLLFADHVHRHFFNGGMLYVDPDDPAWNEESPQRNRPAAFWMRRINEIDPGIRLESARWGDVRRPSQPYTRDREWLQELNSLLNSYFPRRSAIVLNQFRSLGLYPRVGAPVFSHPGGRVAPGVSITLSLPEGTTGTIYYTTDGADPRVSGSGDVSGTARAASGPIVIDDTMRVKARTLDDVTWSALSEVSFEVSTPTDSLYVSEIMFNPLGGSDFEFIELHNGGEFTVELTGLRFSDGIDFSFAPETRLGPGEYLVLAGNAAEFAARYPGVTIAGVYAGNLSNGGEDLTLSGPGDVSILSVDYGDETFWPLGADGFGYSLVRLDPWGDPDDPFNWRASARPHGSPGSADPAPRHSGVFIHEILTRAGPSLEDAVELINTGSQPVSIGGWFLSDSGDDELSLKKYRISSGTEIPAGGHAVLYAREFGQGPDGFDLPETGGGVYLASADASGDLTGHIVGQKYDASVEGGSLGQVDTTTGRDFSPLSQPTFGVDAPASVEEFRTGTGAPNALPRVGPVVIHEIHYHPPPGEEEFLELHNLTGTSVDLSGWRLDGVLSPDETDSFHFPPGLNIPAGGYVVVVQTDPETFRARYSVPAAAPVVGPYGGGLDNGGETLRILRPYDGPDPAGDAEILVDRVRYNDKAPWAVEPDGGGPSLERLRSADYGNEPVNWAASLAMAGTPGAPNSASNGGRNQYPLARLAVTPQPEELRVLLDASESLDPDGTIQDFEWEFGDGASGTGETVLHTYPGAGSYTVRLQVTDNDGASTSLSRVVTVSADAPGGWQIPGDGNQDGVLNLTDVVGLFGRLFLGAGSDIGCDPAASLEQGGNLPLLDGNADSEVNLTDGVLLLNYMFLGGPPPVLGTGCVRIPGCPDACAP